MLRTLISVIAAAIALTLTATTPADTLLNARSAKEINILADKCYTIIKASGINDGPDNFIYRTGEGKRKGPWSQSMIVCPDVSDLTVAETDSAVLVSYRASEQQGLISYSFPFSDPANRQQTSYIGRRSNDVGFTLSSKGESKWSIFFGGVTFGWTGTLDRSDGFSPTVGKSWDISILSLLGLKYRYRAHTLMAGFGLGEQHIVTRRSTYMSLLDDRTIGLLPFAENQTKRSSTLELFRLQVPLLYSYSFGKGGDWCLAAGPVINFNTGASIVTRYKMEGSDYTVKTGHLPRRIVTVDPLISLSYDGLGLFFRYSPMKQFRTHTGVNFNTWSAGVVVLLN